MEIYSDYLNTIKTALQNGKKRQNDSSISYFTGGSDSFEKGLDIKSLLEESRSQVPLPSLKVFADQIESTTDFDQKLGAHPDFKHLKESKEIESHFIVSMFIDIKNSTNLFKRYNSETVFVITNTIQRAAIHTCLIFGGYIHRLQGDGLFVYYGRKGMDEKEAVKKSLQASSLFTYFVKNDLKRLFNEEGIETIFTRIGIDFGTANDVVWGLAGIGEISEITTCSLHTSLASKMQSNAESNGIVVGDNVKDRFVYQELCTPVAKRTLKEGDRYIFRNDSEGFYYTQYDFNWLSYLKKQDYIATDLLGNLSFKRKVNQIRDVEYINPIASTNRPYFNGN